MGGDLSAVITSASRRPRTSMCLVKAGSRPVQIATPAFQPTPGLPRFRPRSSGVLSTIFDKIVGHLTLSPQGQRPRSKPNPVVFTVIKVKRHLPSKSFYESHRRQPSITRYRSNKRKSGMKTLDGQAAQRLHLSLPLNPHWGRIIDREQGSASLEP